MPYPELMVKPMREELTTLGISELRTPEDVERFMAAKEGTTLVVVNSVCGCAAGAARPAMRLALSGAARPDRLGTVFAGQDTEATARARGYFADIPPSSPCFALFKDGELVHFVPRHRIEGRDATQIADDLMTAFERHCGAPVA